MEDVHYLIQTIALDAPRLNRRGTWKYIHTMRAAASEDIEILSVGIMTIRSFIRAHAAAASGAHGVGSSRRRSLDYKAMRSKEKLRMGIGMAIGSRDVYRSVLAGYGYMREREREIDSEHLRRTSLCAYI